MSLQHEVEHLPQAICVDCGWKAIFDSGNFEDQGSRGTFCANQAECIARLNKTHPRRNNKPPEHTEFVSVVQNATLRTQPLLTSSTNGVQVVSGEKVSVLDRRICDEGVLFVQIQTGRKRGWIRSTYIRDSHLVEL